MSEPSIIVLHPSRWREAKALRHEALQCNPEAFATSYEDALSYPDDMWIKRMETAFERDRSIALYVEVDGVLVGMAGAGWSDRRKTRHVAEVYAVYVSPTYRGKGVATVLMRRLLDELNALSQIEKVRLGVTDSNEVAVSLYLRMGFEIVGRATRAIKIESQYYDLCYMEKQLR